MMLCKKFSQLASSLVALCLAAHATTTVTGNVKNLGTGASSTGTFVRFYLRGCAGNQPRVNGTAIIAPTLGNVYYFDFPAQSNGSISGTLYSTRDVTGNSGGDIECGGSTTAVWYGMQAYFNGKAGPETPIHAKNTATIDISNITPITANPVVVAPGVIPCTTPCAQLDAGNQPFTGTVQAPTVIVTGSLTTQSLNSDLWVGTGTGQYSSIAAAYAAASAGQAVHVSANWSETLSANLVLSKNNVGLVFHGVATITMGSFSVTLPGGTNSAFMWSPTPAFGSVGAPGVKFVYTGTGKAFSLGDTITSTNLLQLTNIKVDVSGAGSNAIAVALTQVSGGIFTGLVAKGAGGTTSQLGIVLDGNGTCTCQNTFTGVNSEGFASNIQLKNAANANVFTSSTVTFAATSGIGFDLQSGAVENGFFGLLTESSPTGISLASGANANHFYNVQNDSGITHDVTAAVGSTNNVVQFANAMVGATDSGTGNRIGVASVRNLLNKQNSAAAITGTGADANLFTYTLPAGTLTAGKCLRVKAMAFHNSGTASVTYKLAIGATNLETASSAGNTNSQNEGVIMEICNNAAVQNAQQRYVQEFFATAVVTNVDINRNRLSNVGGTSAIDFTLAQTIAYTFNVANTDTVQPAFFMVEKVE